jgi:hypothetical protein
MAQDADVLKVERIGGLAGFGGPGAHLRSRGQIAAASLSPADRKAVEQLFAGRGAGRASATRDGFSYRITRSTPSGEETIEAPESAVPAALAGCVRDTLD